MLRVAIAHGHQGVGNEEDRRAAGRTGNDGARVAGNVCKSIVGLHAPASVKTILANYFFQASLISAGSDRNERRIDPKMLLENGKPVSACRASEPVDDTKAAGAGLQTDFYQQPWRFVMELRWAAGR